MTAADKKYGPWRPIKEVVRLFGERNHRAQVRLGCGHERSWYAGTEQARCPACRELPTRKVYGAATAARVETLSTEQALAQYDKLINKLSWRAVHQLPASSAFSQEDLYQEGVVVTLQSLAKYKPTKAAFITYLYVSLKNRYGFILKREWRQANAVPTTELMLESDEDALSETAVPATQLDPEVWDSPELDAEVRSWQEEELPLTWVGFG